MCAQLPFGSPCAHCSENGQHSDAQTVSASDLKTEPTCYNHRTQQGFKQTIVRHAYPRTLNLTSKNDLNTFKLKCSQGTESESNAAHIAGFRDIGETWRRELLCKAFGHSWVPERFVHKNQ